MTYKIIDETHVRYLSEDMTITLPPQESYGFAYQAWLDAGNTPEAADVPPPPTIQEQIDALEAPTGAPRWVREGILIAMVSAAAQQGVSEPQLYQDNPGYRKAKDLETAIATLRSQLPK